MRISVYQSRELLALVTGLRNFNREVQTEIRRHTKAMAQPEWQKAVAENASTRLEHRVLAATARVQVSSQNISLQSARVGRKLSGGLDPKAYWGVVEFGTNQNKKTPVTQRSRSGNRYTYLRHSQRQFRPFNKKGYAVYAAAADIIPRIASLWVQTTVRTLAEIIEGKR